MKKLKLKVFNKTTNKYVTKMEKENEKLIFDVFENKFKVLDLNTNNFHEIDERNYDYEFFEYTGQDDINGNEIYDNDEIIFSEEEISGRVVYIKESGSFEISVIDDDIYSYTEALIDEDYKVLKTSERGE